MPPRRPEPEARGYTLLELVIALGISMIAMAAGMTLLIGSQRWFMTGSDDRAMQETARVALDELGSHLRAAGYGMEPSMVFDMGVLASAPMDRLPAGSTARFGGFCGTGACVRDAVDGPDELVFYSRDPDWSRTVLTAGSTATLVLAPPQNTQADRGLSAGQVLQVMCYGAANQWLWAYVTVASANNTNPAQTTVTLRSAGALPFDFPTQNSVLTQSCFTSAGAQMRAFKIDRYRYHVLNVDDGGNVVAATAPGARPYLMLDQGLRDTNGNAIDLPVAPDVEDLQVAYLFPMAPAGSQVLADTGAQVTADVAGLDAGVFNLNPQYPLVIPSFATAPNDIERARTSHHPANIRAVRVAITVRSPRLDSGVADATVPAAFNRTALAGLAGYRRMVFETTAYTFNLGTSFPVFPTYDQNWSQSSPCQTCSKDGSPYVKTACDGLGGTLVLASSGNCGGG